MAYVPDFDSNIGDTNNTDSINFDEIKLSNGKLRINKGINKVIDGGRTGLNLVGSIFGVVAPSVTVFRIAETLTALSIHNFTLWGALTVAGFDAICAGIVAWKTVPVLVRNVPYLSAKWEDFKEDLADDKAARKAAREEEREIFRRGR